MNTKYLDMKRRANVVRARSPTEYPGNVAGVGTRIRFRYTAVCSTKKEIPPARWAAAVLFRTPTSHLTLSRNAIHTHIHTNEYPR